MTDARTHLKGLELLKTGDVSAIKAVFEF